MAKHIHAELMAQYAQDAMETDKPWEMWEAFDTAQVKWRTLTSHPLWVSATEYRRKPETEQEPEYIYSHRLMFKRYDGSFDDAYGLAGATHISVYRRKANEMTDKWIYNIPIPQELSELMRYLPKVAELFNDLNSLEENGF